jgi:shikimate dehydrogenase
MNYYGLIGEHLGHSFSQKWFKEKFIRENLAADYLLIEAENPEKAIELAIQKHHLQGFNVTIPFKKTILPLCDEIDETASEIGAANCVKIKNGKLLAFNTDADGFRHLLVKSVGIGFSMGALILGTGGAAAAVEFVMQTLKIPFLRVSRKPKPDYSIGYGDISLEHLHQYPLVVNTTPLGMFPEITGFPLIPYDLLSGSEILIDLIYNPERTVFMKKGEGCGCNTFNGLPMLIRQAERSWEIWER